MLEEQKVPQWVGCALCGAMSLGAPPHGEGQPCPQKVAIDEAYIAMLDAQRSSYIRSGVGMAEMTSSIRKMIGEDDE